MLYIHELSDSFVGMMEQTFSVVVVGIVVASVILFAIVVEASVAAVVNLCLQTPVGSAHCDRTLSSMILFGNSNRCLTSAGWLHI